MLLEIKPSKSSRVTYSQVKNNNDKKYNKLTNEQIAEIYNYDYKKETLKQLASRLGVKYGTVTAYRFKFNMELKDINKSKPRFNNNTCVD